MKGNGKGGDPKKNRKKNFKRKGKENAQAQNRILHGDLSKNKSKRAVDFSAMGDGKFSKKRVGTVDRPKWTPPKAPPINLPPVLCIWCEKPIREFSSAISDPETGKSVHFDCVIKRIAEREKLEKGDTVGYIGGGRFGVINFSNPQDMKKFRIRKIFEWENKEIRAEWRAALCEHFSTT